MHWFACLLRVKHNVDFIFIHFSKYTLIIVWFSSVQFSLVFVSFNYDLFISYVCSFFLCVLLCRSIVKLWIVYFCVEYNWIEKRLMQLNICIFTHVKQKNAHKKTAYEKKNTNIHTPKLILHLFTLKATHKSNSSVCIKFSVEPHTHPSYDRDCIEIMNRSVEREMYWVNAI